MNLQGGMETETESDSLESETLEKGKLYYYDKLEAEVVEDVEFHRKYQEIVSLEMREPILALKKLNTLKQGKKQSRVKQVRLAFASLHCYINLRDEPAAKKLAEKLCRDQEMIDSQCFDYVKTLYYLYRVNVFERHTGNIEKCDHCLKIERYLLDAKALLEKLKIIEFQEYVDILEDLATLEQDHGNHMQELEYLIRAFGIIGKCDEPEESIKMSMTIAECLIYRLGIPDAGKRFLQLASDINTRLVSKNNELDYCWGNYYMHLKLYDQAILHYEKSLIAEYRGLDSNPHWMGKIQSGLDEAYTRVLKGSDPLAGPATRWRRCGNCDSTIDRVKLMLKGTDFLVCGECRRVPYCDAQCSEEHWEAHTKTCSKMFAPPTRILNYKDKYRCEHCLVVNATLQCPCGKVRYCGDSCQKSHWKLHRTKCSKRK